MGLLGPSGARDQYPLPRKRRSIAAGRGFQLSRKTEHVSTDWRSVAQVQPRISYGRGRDTAPHREWIKPIVCSPSSIPFATMPCSPKEGANNPQLTIAQPNCSGFVREGSFCRDINGVGPPNLRSTPEF
eukprot:Lithocolla_globosa_v1_NODE_10150_length_630_cov_3.706087.p2 type:complete len:129 gc:universal NODE_10150_length_630_cov_3.706087:132-518(+)